MSYESNLEQNNPDDVVEIESDGEIEILDEHLTESPVKIDQKNIEHAKVNVVNKISYGTPT